MHKSGLQGRVSPVIMYTVTSLVLFQVVFAALAPLSLVYNNRMDYNVIKDNLAGVGATLDLIARDIRTRRLQDYVILLGDSVPYSGPGGPSQSVSKHMNDVAREACLPPVYNVAIPAAQMGDFYTLLLMLERRSVSTDHVMLNLTYAGFVKREPDPPIVYWLEKDLRKLDPAAYALAAADLAASSENKNRPGEIESFLEYSVYSRIPTLKYRSHIRMAAQYRLGTASQVLGDTRPWYEKEGLKQGLKPSIYQNQFDATPFVLDDSNLNVVFLRLIAGHLRGKELLVYMSPLNKTLMRQQTSTLGFMQNEDKLDSFLKEEAADYGFQYVDLCDAISHDLFSDHVHLVANGYKALADILWNQARSCKWF